MKKLASDNARLNTYIRSLAGSVITMCIPCTKTTPLKRAVTQVCTHIDHSGQSSLIGEFLTHVAKFTKHIHACIPGDPASTEYFRLTSGKLFNLYSISNIV